MPTALPCGPRLTPSQLASFSKSFQESHSSATTTLSTLIDHTGAFLSSGIQEDLPTGITPRKKAWDVRQTWERTEPRDVLLANSRRRAGQIEAPAAEAEAVIVEVESAPQYASSTDSLEEKAREEVGSGHGNTVGNGNGLSTSQMGKRGKVVPAVVGKNGFGFAAVVEERPVLSVLGEGGVNVPRRTRK